jgi:hypothetical protein
MPRNHPLLELFATLHALLGSMHRGHARFLMEHVEAYGRMIIVDAWAQHGFYTKEFAKVPGAVVHAFEPLGV